MNDLQDNSANGNVTIDNEVFDIVEGRLSFTPKEDFYLINFWIKSEDCESRNGVFPPTIEILIKTKENLLEINKLNIEMPSDADTAEEWQENYDTGYYDGIHQNFKYAKMEISKMHDNIYLVEFSGIPEMYKGAKGSCRVELKDELIMIWG